MRGIYTGDLPMQDIVLVSLKKRGSRLAAYPFPFSRLHTIHSQHSTSSHSDFKSIPISPIPNPKSIYNPSTPPHPPP